MVGLAEYICTHPILYFYRRRSRLCTRRRWVGIPSCTQPCLWIRVTRRSYRMAQDSDDFFVLHVLIWVVVVVLAIVALHCPLLRRVVRWCTIWCNKCAISILRLKFISHLSLLLWGDTSGMRDRLTFGLLNWWFFLSPISLVLWLLVDTLLKAQIYFIFITKTLYCIHIFI